MRTRTRRESGGRVSRPIDEICPFDFISGKSFTKVGVVDIYLLSFIALATRRVWLSLFSARSAALSLRIG